MIPKIREIWLVAFPFSNLTTVKLRPALVIATHRQEAIILGIFSKIPVGKFSETWVLIDEHHLEFKETGLKKTSLIRADKIATVNEFVFHKKLGSLSINLMDKVNSALKKSLNL
jgi:mRNA interferase MazF